MTTTTALPVVPAPRQPTEPQPVRAACAGVSSHEFFRGDGEYRRTALDRMQRTARRYCAHCPLLVACGRTADRFDDEGLWGGVARLRNKNVMDRHELLGGPR